MMASASNLHIYQGDRHLILAVGRLANPRDYVPPPPSDVHQWLIEPGRGTLTVHLSSSAELAHYLRSLQDTFSYVEAAGGVVENALGEVLLFFRRGMWDLPKGKIDPGEEPQAAALREIEEETGLTRLEVIRHLCDTYHVYFLANTWWLKRTHWYHVKGDAIENLVPQTEEDITLIEWARLPISEDRPTYATIHEVLAAYVS